MALIPVTARVVCESVGRTGNKMIYVVNDRNTESMQKRGKYELKFKT